MVFVGKGCGDRFAIHLENKPSHRAWEPLQAENYRKRALDRKKKWRYVDYQTMLLAPAAFLAKSSNEISHFDLTLTYEEVAAFVPEFGLACTTNVEKRASSS